MSAERIKQLEINIEALLRNTAEFTRPCKRAECQTLLFMVRHVNGTLTPYTFDGTNHYDNCPGSSQLKKKAAAQGQINQVTTVSTAASEEASLAVKQPVQSSLLDVTKEAL